MQRADGKAARARFAVVIPRFRRKTTAKANATQIPSCLDKVAATAKAVPASKSSVDSVFRVRTKKIAARIIIAVKGTSVRNVFDIA